MIKKFTIVLIAGTALAAGLGSTAYADLHMYADSNDGAWIGSRNTTGWWNMQPANNDKLSSMKNETNWGAAFWHHANRTGHCWSYGPWTADPSFHWTDNDKVTSYALGQGC